MTYQFFQKHAAASLAAVIFFCFTSFHTVAQQATSALTGIYVLDGNRGTFRDANIRDYDFVDGFAWRYSWREMEPSQGIYDFKPLTHIVTRLAAIDKKFSWIIMPDLPRYLSQDRQISTYIAGGTLRPLPWDPELLERYRAFLTAAANHRIADPKAGERPVRLRDHSAFALFHPTFPGTPGGAIRDEGEVSVSSVPGFTREQLIEGNILPVMNMTKALFPNQVTFVSLWPIHDGNRRQALWEDIEAAISRYSKTGLWMDNLAANRPCPNCSNYRGFPEKSWAQHLANTNGLLTGFQMLGSWDRPFNINHVPKLRFGQPTDGIEYGMQAFNAQYFEVYVWDIDNPAWHSELRQYHQQLHQ